MMQATENRFAADTVYDSPRRCREDGPIRVAASIRRGFTPHAGGEVTLRAVHQFAVRAPIWLLTPALIE
jgi:hypothetical protein